MKPCPICHCDSGDCERTLNDIELVRCNDCSFVYANLGLEAIKAANSGFDDQAVAKFETYQTSLNDLWFHKIVRDFTQRLGPGRVLDIGCGNGRLLRLFEAQGWECHGADLSPWSESFADKYNFQLHGGTVEEIDFGATKFDLITSTSTFEHIPEPLQHLERVMSLLRPGGVAYFCGVPNYGSLSVRLGWSAFHANRPSLHVNYFTPVAVQRALALLPSPPAAASISSYGIPEFHRFYNKATYRLKRLRGNRKNSDRDGTSRDTSVGDGFWRPGARSLLRWSLQAYYLAGRPFRIGDKLQITLVR